MRNFLQENPQNIKVKFREEWNVRAVQAGAAVEEELDGRRLPVRRAPHQHR